MWKRNGVFRTKTRSKAAEKKAVELPEIKGAEAPGKKVEEDYYSPAPWFPRQDPLENKN